MAFEDKMSQLKNGVDGLSNNENKIQNTPRVSKSYTLKKIVADELAEKAREQELTASRYLEKILKKEFNL